MSSEFLPEVRKAFEFLEREYGYRLGRDYVSDSFDNAAVDYDGPLPIAVIRERSQIFVHVQPPRGQSFHLALLLRWLGAQSDLDALLESGQTSIHLVADIFRRHFPQIRDAFAPERRTQSAHELLELAELWATERWGPLPS